MYVAIYQRGALYMQQRKWDLAMADFNTALKVSPSFFLAAIKRAEVNQADSQATCGFIMLRPSWF